jgi:hypothetical protein
MRRGKKMKKIGFIIIMFMVASFGYSQTIEESMKNLWEDAENLQVAKRTVQIIVGGTNWQNVTVGSFKKIEEEKFDDESIYYTTYEAWGKAVDGKRFRTQYKRQFPDMLFFGSITVYVNYGGIEEYHTYDHDGEYDLRVYF